MKIGIVLNNVPGYSEGFFHNKINGLINEGNQVVLFAVNSENKKIPGWNIIEPYHLPRNVFFRLISFLVVILKLLFFKPIIGLNFLKFEKKCGRDLSKAFQNLYINAHILLEGKLDWLHFGFATAALRRESVAKVIGAKMAVSFRGYDIGIYPIIHPGCYTLLWKRVDKVHTISNDLLIKAYSLGLSKGISVVKITPAIDCDKYFVSRDQRRSVTPNIITIARLNWKKGLSYSILVMKKLKDQGINFKYTIVGDGEEKEHVMFMIKHFGLEDYIAFTGKVTSDKISQYLAQNDIYFQPSVQEGFCNSVLEAQLAGLMCVVSDAEGLSENVLDGKTGWVVKRRDVDGFVHAILNILKISSDERYRIVEAAQSRVRNNFSLQEQQKRFADFYND